MKLVLVEWVDAFGCSPYWVEFKNIQPEKVLCKSVGWILHKDKNDIVIVPHVSKNTYSTEPQGCGEMTIPVKFINKITNLKN